MGKVTIDISDDLLDRLRSHLREQGEGLAEFVSRAVEDRLSWEDDPLVQAQVDAQIKQSVSELERGEGVDARQAMREIADEFGIRLNQ